jgi:3-oxoacyl-[acyl-carrier protein] reductase
VVRQTPTNIDGGRYVRGKENWPRRTPLIRVEIVKDLLQGQVAVVTGAGRGIGRAIAVRLAATGCRVAALARTESELDETVAEALRTNERASVIPVPADVTRDADLEQAVRFAIERLGRVTILVNNAGFAPPRGSVLKTSLGDWDRTLETCLRAPMVLTRLVLPDMLAHGHGAIVNIASIAGKRGRAGEAAYAAAKFGLLGFTQALFAEVRDHGIRVTAVCPGLVDTDLIPPNKRVDRSKFLLPEDIAEVVWQVLIAPSRSCPTEVVVEPLLDPEQD